MKKESDFLMIGDWEDFDLKSPVFVLTKAGLSMRDAGAVVLFLVRFLYRLSSDGVQTAEIYRAWLGMLGFSPEEVDKIMATSLFVPVDGDGENLFFVPFSRQAQGLADYRAKAKARHERAVAAGKASGAVPNKGRFQKSSGNAATKPQKVEEQKVESVEVEEKVEEQKVESVEVEEKVEENKVETEGRKDSRELLRTYAQTMRQSIEERENAIPQRVYRGQAAFLASLRKEREAED